VSGNKQGQVSRAVRYRGTDGTYSLLKKEADGSEKAPIVANDRKGKGKKRGAPRYKKCLSAKDRDQ